MDGINAFDRFSSVAFLHTQGSSISLGLPEHNPTFLVAVDLGLPDPVPWVRDNVYNVAFPQVLAFSTAVIGITAVIYFVKAFRS